MESFHITGKTLPVSSAFTLTFGATESPHQQLKTIRLDEYNEFRLWKTKKKHRKKKKKKSKKKSKKKNVLNMSSPTLRRKSIQLADNIEEGISLHGDNREAMIHGFQKTEAEDKDDGYH